MSSPDAAVSNNIVEIAKHVEAMSVSFEQGRVVVVQSSEQMMMAEAMNREGKTSMRAKLGSCE